MKIQILSAIIAVIFLTSMTAGCVNIDTSNIEVTFYVDDSVYGTLDLGNSNTITLPVDPKKEGYTFKGWYFDKGIWQNPVSKTSLEDMTLKSNISVYAYFVEDKENDVYYVVKFDTRKGSWIPEQSVLSGGLVQVPNNPTRDSYTFSGWYTDESFTDEWLFARDEVTSDMTLYAKWTSTKSPVYYRDSLMITPLNEFDGVYTDGEKMYIRYNIAKVTGATVSVVSDVVLNTGGDSLKVSSSSAISKSTTESLEKTISISSGCTVGFSDASTVGGSVAVFGSSVEFSKTLTVYGEARMDITGSISDSVSNTIEYATTDTSEYGVDLSGYPQGKLYRYVILSDCIISQTFEVDLATGKVTAIYYDSRIIDDGTPYTRVVQYCEIGEGFSTEQDAVDYRRVSIDTSPLFNQGSGTKNNPYVISSMRQCLVIPLDSTKHYKLMSDIDTTPYPWFDGDKYLEMGILDTNGFTLLPAMSGKGTVNSPYRISNADEFMEIYGNLSAHYVLTNDIDLSGYPLKAGNGNFCGSLDGNGYTISNGKITIDATKYATEQYVGLFGSNSGTIKDVTLEKFVLYSSSQHNGAWVQMGCVAGRNYGIISDVKIIDSNVQCHRSGSSMGGITGSNMQTGIITNCAVTGGLIFGNGDGGGIAGTNYGTITDCTVTGNGIGASSNDYEAYHFFYYYAVTGKSDNGGIPRSWGGIVGYAPSTSTITNVAVKDLFLHCYYDGSLSSSVGYVVGYNAGKISGSYSVKNVREISLGDSSANTKKYYLPGNGYVGQNYGSIPW